MGSWWLPKGKGGGADAPRDGERWVLIGLLALLCIPLSAVGCEDSSPVLEGEDEIHGLAFDVLDLELLAGDSLKLRAFFVDEDGEPVEEAPGSELVWSSSDSTVARVNSGTVTGQHPGEATVGAEHPGTGRGGAAAIPVRVGHRAPFSLEIVEGDGQEVAAGQEASEGLEVQVLDRLGNPVPHEEVAFSVASGEGALDPDTAVTNDEGKATSEWTVGGEAGTQAAIAEAEDLDPVTFEVTVVPGPVEDVGVTPDSVTVDVGEGVELEAVATDGFGNEVDGGDPPAWESTDPAVATVSEDGYVEGRMQGLAVVTATVDGVEGRSTIHVEEPPDDDGSGGTPSAPEVVTDLAVESTSETTVTLAWTEVDDGAGGAAHYVVRWHEHPMEHNWGSATHVEEGSCASPVEGTEPGQTLACTVEGMEPGTDLDFQLASYRGEVEGGTKVVEEYGDLSNVAEATTKDSDDGGSGGDPGEGTGADVLFAEDWESGDFRQWDDGPSRPHDWNVVHDPAEALAGENLLEVRIPADQNGGYLGVFRDLAPGTREIYVRAQVKLGAGWEGFSRLFLVRASDPDHGQWPWHAMGGAGTCPGGDDLVRIGVAAWDEGGSLPVSRWYNYWHGMWTEPNGSTCWGRHSPDPRDRDATYTDASPHLPVGEWFTMEIHLRLNDVGESNGFARMWVDGTLRSDWRGEDWRTSSDLLFNILQIDLRADAPVDRWVYFDDIVVQDAPP